MKTTQLPMFGCTLIVQGADQVGMHTQIRLKRAASDSEWTFVLPQGDLMIVALSRPGAVLALVELANHEVPTRRGA